jgi:hypothetical protein
MDPYQCVKELIEMLRAPEFNQNEFDEKFGDLHQWVSMGGFWPDNIGELTQELDKMLEGNERV